MSLKNKINYFLGKNNSTYIILFLLILPSIVWVFLDNHVWPWDQAWYGEVSVNLYYNFVHSFSNWSTVMIGAFGIKAPAIAWFGQFFVPLSNIVGSVDRALMLQIILVQFLSLVLIYKIVFKLTKGEKTLALLGSLIMASAPLFVGMNHQYFVESSQLFAVTILIFIMVNIQRWNRYDSILSLIFISSYLMLIKISSPLYVVFPSLTILYYLIKNSREVKFRDYFKEKKHIFFYIIGFLFAFSVFDWYFVNWNSIYNFVKSASSGSAAELYGSKESFLKKIEFWLSYFQASFFVPTVAYVIYLLAGVFSVNYFFKRKKFNFDKLISLPVLSVFSIAIVLLVFSFQINQETRYLLPILPYVVIVICWLLYAINNKWLNRFLIVAFVVQFMLVNGITLGLMRGNAQNISPYISPWDVPLQRNSNQKNNIELIISKTCNTGSMNKINIVGVEFPWLNENSVEYYATQKKLNTNIQCYYTSLGYAETDLNKALEKFNLIKPPYFITVFPDSLQKVDTFNAVSIPVAKFIMKDKEFSKQNLPYQTPVLIFNNNNQR